MCWVWGIWTVHHLFIEALLIFLNETQNVPWSKFLNDDRVRPFRAHIAGEEGMAYKFLSKPASPRSQRSLYFQSVWFSGLWPCWTWAHLGTGLLWEWFISLCTTASQHLEAMCKYKQYLRPVWFCSPKIIAGVLFSLQRILFLLLLKALVNHILFFSCNYKFTMQF